MNAKENGNTPAMPVVVPEKQDSYIDLGLTKREQFAMVAMQGYIAGITGWSDGLDGGGCSLTPEECAKESINYADALLKALEESK